MRNLLEMIIIRIFRNTVSVRLCITFLQLAYVFDDFVLRAPVFISFIVRKYWPDDGLFRSKLATNSRIIIKYYTVLSDGVHVQFASLMYFNTLVPELFFLILAHPVYKT